jgi:hypothetical protein
MKQTTDEPSEIDVLCGQDATFLQHTGNKLLRYQMDLVLEEYKQCDDRRRKITLIDKIIEVMRKNYCSRFLRQRPGTSEWEEIDQQSIRDKVSHALRFAARRRCHRNCPGKGKSRVPRLAQSQRAAKLNDSLSSSSSFISLPCLANDESLDEESKVRVANMHQLQQRILGRMMVAPDKNIVSNDEDLSLSLTSSSHSRSTQFSTDMEDNTFEDMIVREVPRVGPLPFLPGSMAPQKALNVQATSFSSVSSHSGWNEMAPRGSMAHVMSTTEEPYSLYAPAAHHHCRHPSMSQEHQPFLPRILDHQPLPYNRNCWELRTDDYFAASKRSFPYLRPMRPFDSLYHPSNEAHLSLPSKFTGTRKVFSTF